jgi:hypothetical protein
MGIAQYRMLNAELISIKIFFHGLFEFRWIDKRVTEKVKQAGMLPRVKPLALTADTFTNYAPRSTRVSLINLNKDILG